MPRSPGVAASSETRHPTPSPVPPIQPVMPLAPPNLCLFDLDQTLLPIDSDHAWGEFMIALGWVDAAAFRAGNDAFYADYRAGRLDIAAYIAFAAAPLAGRSATELAAGRE